jgi:hypothetical protein
MVPAAPTTLREHIVRSLTDDFTVRNYAKTPTLEEMTDTLQADVERQYRNLLEFDNLNAYFDLARGAPLPDVSQARQHAHAAFQDLVKASRDPLLFASGNVPKICAKLAEPAEKFVNASADYCAVLLQANQRARRLGKRETVGACVQVTWYTYADELIDTTVSPRLMRFAFERLPADHGEQAAIREHVIAYIPKQTTTPPQFGRANAFRRDIARCIERYPRVLRPLFRLEHGHKIQGQGELVTVLLLGNVVAGIFPPIYHDPTSRHDQSRGHRHPSKANAPKRRSVWAALHGTTPAVLLLSMTIISSTAQLASIHFFQTPAIESRLEDVERLRPILADSNMRLSTTSAQVASSENRSALAITRIDRQEARINEIVNQQTAFKSQLEQLLDNLARHGKADADHLKAIRAESARISELQTDIARLDLEQRSLNSQLSSLPSAQTTAPQLLAASPEELASVKEHLKAHLTILSMLQQRLAVAEDSLGDIRETVFRVSSSVQATDGRSISDVAPELEELQSTIDLYEHNDTTLVAQPCSALKDSPEREQVWHDW